MKERKFRVRGNSEYLLGREERPRTEKKLKKRGESSEEEMKTVLTVCRSPHREEREKKDIRDTTRQEMEKNRRDRKKFLFYLLRPDSATKRTLRAFYIYSIQRKANNLHVIDVYLYIDRERERLLHSGIVIRLRPPRTLYIHSRHRRERREEREKREETDLPRRNTRPLLRSLSLSLLMGIIPPPSRPLSPLFRLFSS